MARWHQASARCRWGGYIEPGGVRRHPTEPIRNGQRTVKRRATASMGPPPIQGTSRRTHRRHERHSPRHCLRRQSVSYVQLRHHPLESGEARSSVPESDQDRRPKFVQGEKELATAIGPSSIDKPYALTGNSSTRYAPPELSYSVLTELQSAQSVLTVGSRGYPRVLAGIRAMARGVPCLHMRRIALYSMAWRQTNPQRPRDVFSLTLPLSVPGNACPRIYNEPRLPFKLQPSMKKVFKKVAKPTIVPLMLAVGRLGELHSEEGEFPFQIVTHRDNLVKMGADDGKWEVGVQRLDGILYLRYYRDKERVDLSDVKYQFRRQCTGRQVDRSFDDDYRSVLLASTIRIGNFKILMETEIDAVDRDTPSLAKQLMVEVDIAKRWPIPQGSYRWLQMFLGGIDRLYIGVRDKCARVKTIHDADIDALVDDCGKRAAMSRLQLCLEYMNENVDEGKFYVYRSSKLPHQPPELEEVDPDSGTPASMDMLEKVAERTHDAAWQATQERRRRLSRIPDSV